MAKNADQGAPVEVVVIMPRDSKSVADGAYLGPLRPADVSNLPALVKLLTKEPSARMKAGRAEELLDSPNPWIAWLGLTRLAELGTLRAKHFAHAIRSRVPADAVRVWAEMINGVNLSGMDSTMATSVLKATPELPQQLLRLGGNSAMQKVFLREVVTNITRQWKSGRRADGPVDYLALQKAAQEYREEIKDDSTRAGVLRQLDALIALK